MAINKEKIDFTEHYFVLADTQGHRLLYVALPPLFNGLNDEEILAL